MKLFSKTLYHGTPHDFDKFDTEHIGMGEGHQAHGWGLYFAENKEIAKSYQERLSKAVPIYHITIDGKTQDVKRKDVNGLPLQEMLLDWIKYADDINELKEYVYDRMKHIKWNIDEFGPSRTIANKSFHGTIEQYLHELEYVLKFIDEHNLTFSVSYENIPSVVYTVEIPDSLIFIDEEKNITEDILKLCGYITEAELKQKYIEKIKPILKEQDKDNLLDESLISSMANYIASDIIDGVDIGDKLLNFFKDIYYLFGRRADAVNWNGATAKIIAVINLTDFHFMDICTGRRFYDNIKDMTGSDKNASLFLEQHGINGITYNGETDGRCYVIFNPENINIVEKE